MKLYQIKTRLLGDDLDQESVLGFLLSNSDEEVFNFITTHYTWGEPGWEDQYEHGAKKRIFERQGDFHEEYLGDQYDQKFAWLDMGIATDKELATLRKFQIPFLGENING